MYYYTIQYAPKGVKVSILQIPKYKSGIQNQLKWKYKMSVSKCTSVSKVESTHCAECAISFQVF